MCERVSHSKNKGGTFRDKESLWWDREKQAIRKKDREKQLVRKRERKNFERKSNRKRKRCKLRKLRNHERRSLSANGVEALHVSHTAPWVTWGLLSR